MVHVTHHLPQITFSRDWLAGSGKRSGKVTFSRDWLAGSGKRSGPVVPVVAGGDVAPAEVAITARQTIETLIDYLATQLTVSTFLPLLYVY